MTTLRDVFDEFEIDNTPLPLIVAKHFNFPLAHNETEDGLFYAIQDWMRGLLGGDVRNLLSMFRRRNPHLNSSIKMLPYRTSNDKVYRIPYTDEERLMFILVNARLSRGRYKLVDVRNFIADISSEYEYLRCTPVASRKINEHEFQSMLVATLKKTQKTYELYEYYGLPSGRIIDILAVKSELSLPYMVIECKLDIKDFYKAIGQVACYQAEILQGLSPESNVIIALAVPNEAIDDYVRQMASLLSIHLITIVNGIVMDAITGEPFSLDVLER